MNTGIYLITNTINNKCYIGQAVDINRRFNEHKLFHNSNILLTNSIKKYKVENFSFDILEITPPTKEALDEAESFWIDYFKSLGYSLKNTLFNFVNGGNRPPNQTGFRFSELSRMKLSQSKKGHLTSIETREKIGLKHKGKTTSYETRIKQSEAKKISKYLEQSIIDNWNIFNISQRQLAKILNIPHGTLHDVLVRNNINIRKAA
jgi:group I intron endonuclease